MPPQAPDPGLLTGTSPLRTHLLMAGIGPAELMLVGLVLVVLVLAVVGFVLIRRPGERERGLHADLHEQRHDIERREHRIAEREHRLDNETRSLDERAHELADAEASLASREAELADLEAERVAVLERAAGLSAEDARAELVESIEHDAKRSAALLARDIERAAVDEAELRARRTLATVIQRLASEQTSESVVSSVQLPSDDMKAVSYTHLTLPTKA